MNKKNLALLSAILAPSLAFASLESKSDLPYLEGTKYPNSQDEGLEPIKTFARPLRMQMATNGFNALLPYVLRSPHQEEAGSCLYMTLTGTAEWWLAKLNPKTSREPDGPLDLSERYLMNLAGTSEASNGVKNWRTDSIYIFNKEQRSVRNTHYRFTKGWFKTNSAGRYVAATTKETGASYNTNFNWVNQLNTVQAPYVDLPRFERQVIFADPEANQWNVGIAPKDIVQSVKNALMKFEAPVQVVYNHMGYWHSVMIVGFDDTQDNGNCPFVERFISYMTSEAKKFSDQERLANDPKEKTRLRARHLKALEAANKSRSSYQGAGGCNPKGVFYVRDSIYGDKNGPVYDYDLSRKGEESPYSQRIITHEYEWLSHLSNHVYQVLLK